MAACGEAVSKPGCDAAPSEKALQAPTPQEAAAPPLREAAAEDEQPADVPEPEHALSARAVESGTASSPTEDAGSIAQQEEQVLPSAAETAPPRQAEPFDIATARSEFAQGTDLDAALVAVGTAAREWGVRADDLEGRFVSALMVAIRSVGEVSRAAQSDFRHLFQEARHTADAEYAQARELAKAARAVLGQARSALIFQSADQETVVARMIETTLPLFAKNLRDVMVIREQRWNRDQARRRYALAGVVCLGVFLAGYGLHAWSSRKEAVFAEACLEHQVSWQGHLLCDLTALAAARPQ